MARRIAESAAPAALSSAVWNQATATMFWLEKAPTKGNPMADQRFNATRLLLAVSIFAGMAATAKAAPDAPVARYGAAHAPMLRNAHYLVAIPPRVQTIPVVAAGSDVVPIRRDTDDQPRVQLGPETAHYDHAPDGLDDDPTTFGLVAKF
jgi:hypothetical protein